MSANTSNGSMYLGVADDLAAFPRSPVFHGSELSLIFGPVPNPIEDDFANQLTDFYISFVTDLNPGCGHRFHFYFLAFL